MHTRYMPVVGAGILVLLVIIVSTSLTSASPEPEVLIRASVGGEVTRAKIEFPLPIVRPQIVLPEPVEVIIPPTPAPRPKVAPVVVPVQPVPVPVALVPTQDPSITACLGKFVGTSCAFTKDGVENVGTCMTPAFSPVVCILH